MEDPWGSPWTADSTPKLDLPTPPPSAHFSLENHSQQRPASSSERLPWEDNDPWGGWNEAGADRISTGWRRSPGLEPVASTASSSRQVSPGPWKLTHFENVSRSESRNEKLEVEEVERRGTSDSGISLDVPIRDDSTEPKPAIAEEPEVTDGVQDISVEGQDTPTQARSPSPTLEEEKPVPEPVAQAEQAADVESRPDATRQTSKVQELVQMYDGIAKRNASPAPSGLQTPPRMKKVEELSDDATKELLGINELEAAIKSPTIVDLDYRTALGSNKLSETQDAEEVDDGDATEEVSQNFEDSPEKQSPISFKVDMSKLDDLFPSTKLPHVEPEPVPDVIIDDTFASISERKAWYRISRYGSVRKHNHGDDENYTTISWKASEVRGQAIRIVRRWMEEDSITGRVVLGRRGGLGGASMFNWDSKAPNVGIGELLARKSTHSRHVSTVSKSSVEPTSAEPSPSAAAFGWSSGPLASPGLSKTLLSAAAQKHTSLPPSATTRASLERVEEVEKSTRPQSLAPAPNGQAAPRILPPPKVETRNDSESESEDEDESDEDEDEDEDDDEIDYHHEAKSKALKEDVGQDDNDDEWGEMVSSPTKDDGFDDHLLGEPDQKSHLHEGKVPSNSLGDGFKASFMGSRIEASFSQLKSGPNDMLVEDAGLDMAKDDTAENTAAVPKEPEHKEDAQLDLPTPKAVTFREPHSPEDSSAESSDQSDQETVAEILRHIPDLTYMLR